jgi:hypothetical protein
MGPGSPDKKVRHAVAIYSEFFRGATRASSTSLAPVKSTVVFINKK